MWPCLLTRIAALAVAAVVVPAICRAEAQPKTRDDCERTYKPQIGQKGKDIVWAPTPDGLVERMLAMANVTPQDYVVDLGAGDGKIAIAAAKHFGARSLGIEYNPDLVKLANCMVRVEGVVDRAKIVRGNIFEEDFSKADVVTMYLSPEINLCLRHRILAMRPGTRVASHEFGMGDWSADESIEFAYRTNRLSAHLWTVPAKVAGTWTLEDDAGTRVILHLSQRFQKVSGEVTLGGVERPLVSAALRGDELTFAIDGDEGTRTFTGTVEGKTASGVLRGPDGGETQMSGSRQGDAEPAAWAEMTTGCDRFQK